MFLDSRLLIVGFDVELNKFVVSDLQQILPTDWNNKDSNLIEKILKNYEWILDKAPISQEESVFEGTDLSTLPNIKTIRLNDIFNIRWRNNNDVIFANQINSENNFYLNSLSLGNLALTGRNGYWMMFPSRLNSFAIPNWYLFKKTLGNKVVSENFHLKKSFALRFIEFGFSKSSQFVNLITGCLSNMKIPRLQVEEMILVSDPPIGWNNSYLYLNKSQNNIEINKSNLFNESKIPLCIGGYVFDHAKLLNDTSIPKNVYLKPLSSFPSKIQEQLLLEDILNCLMCMSGNYIKVIEYICPLEFSSNISDFSPEALFLIKTSNSDKDLFENSNLDSYLSVKEGLSEFSHYIIDDPTSDTFFQDFLQDNSFLDSKNSINKYNQSLEFRSEELDNYVNKNDPMLYPLTYRILELSSLHRRIRQFIGKHNNNIFRFGVISETLCETFHELLKHFTIKISKFETLVRKGQFSLQNLWSQSQQALTTLKLMDLIADRVLYKSGCAIINSIFNILQENLQGDVSQQKIANFILHQLLTTWMKFFLIPWLKSGEINDPYDEFNNLNFLEVKENNSSITCLKKIAFSENKKLNYSLLPNMLPIFLNELFSEINYIGNVNYLISHADFIYKVNKSEIGNILNCTRNSNLQANIEQVIKLLNMNSENLKIEIIKEFVSKLYCESRANFYNFCNSRVDIKRYFKLFNDIFFCFNDALVQEFIDSIGIFTLGSNLSGNFYFNHISQKWNELATRYYKNNLEVFEESDFEFSCTFNKKLLTEDLFLELPTQNIINFDEIYSQSKNSSFEFTKTISLNFETFKHLTINFSPNNNLKKAIWSNNILNKYQIIFRLIFQLKYVLNLLNNVWLVHQTTPLWEYLPLKVELKENSAVNINLNGKASISYFLRQKMILIISGILEYILYDVIEPSWNSNIYGKLEEISTVEELIKSQESMLDDILSHCFCKEHDLFYSLYKIISICHLFTRHSILFNIYGLTGSKKSAFKASMDIDSSVEKCGISEDELQKSKCKSRKFNKNRKGRYKLNRPHVERLLEDPSFSFIMKKFESNFMSLLTNFFQLIFKCKGLKLNLINKLISKLNYSGYYGILEGLPQNFIVKDQYLIDNEDSNEEYLESD